MSQPVATNIRVWYVPQMPVTSFLKEVPDLATAELLLETLQEFSAFELDHRIKPDYADMGGIEVFVDGEWEEYDEDFPVDFQIDARSTH